METRFPRATEAECADAGGSCAICLQPLADARRLPCNHVFHLMCLRQWLQRVEANNTCPVCRQSVHGHQDRDHAAPAPPAAAAGAPAGAGAAGGGDGGAAAADGAAGGGAAVTPEAMAAATAAVEGLGLRRRVPPRPTPTAAAAPPTATAGAGTAATPAAAAPPAGTRRVAVARGVDFGHESLFHFSTEGWGQWLPNLSFQVVTNRDGGGGGGVDPAAAVAEEAAAAGGAGGLLAMLRGLGRPTLTPEQVANMVSFECMLRTCVCTREWWLTVSRPCLRVFLRAVAACSSAGGVPAPVATCHRRRPARHWVCRGHHRERASGSHRECDGRPAAVPCTGQRSSSRRSRRSTSSSASTSASGRGRACTSPRASESHAPHHPQPGTCSRPSGNTSCGIGTSSGVGDGYGVSERSSSSHGCRGWCGGRGWRFYRSSDVQPRS